MVVAHPADIPALRRWLAAWLRRLLPLHERYQLLQLHRISVLNRALIVRIASAPEL